MNTKQGMFRTSLLVGTLLAAFLAGCGNSAADHLAKAKKLSAENDHKGAIIELKNTLQADPKMIEARVMLGQEFLQQGDPRNAEIELQKALDQRQDPDQVVPLLVKAMLLQGQTEKAVRVIRTAELKSPQANAELQTLLGVSLFGMNKPDEALTAFATANRYVPNYPDAMLGEARIRASRNNFAEAKTLVDQVLAQSPKQVDALILKGDLARAQGNQADAMAAYEAALKEKPDNFLARMNLAGVLIAQKQVDAALPHIAALRKAAPKHPGVAYLAALAAFNRKDYAKANEEITASLAAAPNNAAAQLLGGAIATALNEQASAEEHLREALKLNPSSVYARKLLASLYLRQRQPQKADETLQPALLALPRDPSLQSLAGEIALMKGDFDAASKSFETASRLNPDDSNIRTQSAAIQFARGDATAGFAELEEASKSATTNANPDIALVLAHLQRRQYDQAIKSWNTLQKRQPDNPVTWNLRAAIDLGRNDVPSARKALEKALELQPTYFPAVANLAGIDLREKKLDSARDRYKALIKRDPQNVTAMLALAQLENANGASDETVLSLLRDAKRASPGSEQPVGALVGFYLTKRDPKQALAVAQEALAASPSNPRYLDLVGQLMMQTGSTDQAIAAYRKLVQINPEATQYQVRLGQAQLVAGQNEVALQTFSNALKQKPDSIEAQSATISAMLRAGRNDEAVKLLAQVKQQTPRSPAIPELDGDVKFATRQYGEAAAIYRKLIEQAPNGNMVVKTYSSLALDGKRSEADAFLAGWLKSHPKDVQARTFDADIALRSKDYKRAATAYRAVLDLQPDNPVMLNNLAWTLSQQNDPQALAIAEKANTLAPDNPLVNDTLGWMLVEKGELKRGIGLLEKASAAAPQSRDIALHLAKAQMKDGRKDAARSTLQALVKASPDSVEGQESKELLAKL